MNPWHEIAKRRNEATRQAGRWREIRDLEGTGPVFRTPDGREVVSFASNDYLGLTHHPAVITAAKEALDTWGSGAGSARLIVGARPIHRRLEEALADWKGTESAALFPTGYAANLGVLSALGTSGVTILSDSLNHASIVDGCRLARAEVTVYPHADLAVLRALLEETPAPAIVVSDSVFSMDGDVAPVEDLRSLCDEHGALLVLDEAHAVFGSPSPGAGAVRVGTLSKFLGAAGGYVACDAEIADLIVNEARPFIFTTAGAPADAAAALAALQIARSTEGEGLIARLRAHVDAVRPGHPSPIIPVVVGHENDAVAASRTLLERGFLVPAIRPPSVPEGTSRLRVTLSAAHTDEQVQGLVSALAEVTGA